MSRTVTSEVLIAYSLCPQKAFLLLCTEEKGTLHKYEQILQQQQHATQNHSHTALLQTNLDIRSYAPAALTSACESRGSVRANIEVRLQEGCVRVVLRRMLLLLQYLLILVKGSFLLSAEEEKCLLRAQRIGDEHFRCDSSAHASVKASL